VSEQNCDVLIVGAGPAGLTAAVYLARYRRRVLVVHDETSRAARIPLTRNVPGFPAGVAGPELLQRMRDQALLYGAEIRRDRIHALEQHAGFQALGGEGTYRARSVVLATGISMNEIDLPKALHEEAIRLACLRYCPICDGFEATHKVVAVLGSNAHGAREALFLREYTDQVTLLAREACELSAAQRRELDSAGVQVRDAPAVGIQPDPTGMHVTLADNTRLRFDVLYPALGCQPRSELAAQLGVKLSKAGCIPTDAGQAIGLSGLYAAGDVVDALDQISVAIGHGAIAATHAHNWLREQDGRMLEAT
jgi:thioredoxin reductase (NADPH)